MNNRYNELDNTLKTSIDVLIDCLASCQNKAQNEEIFNEIIKDAFKEITTNHQCYLSYKARETKRIEDEIQKINRNISYIVNMKDYNITSKRNLINNCLDKIQNLNQEILDI